MVVLREEGLKSEMGRTGVQTNGVECKQNENNFLVCVCNCVFVFKCVHNRVDLCLPTLYDVAIEAWVNPGTTEQLSVFSSHDHSIFKSQILYLELLFLS